MTVSVSGESKNLAVPIKDSGPQGPPAIQVIDAKNHVDAQITIGPLPPIDHGAANSCAIQNVVNDVKNAFIEGECDDVELNQLVDGRNFSFCMTHVIRHSQSGKLNIDFYISHTETAPAWRTEQPPANIIEFIGRRSKKKNKKPTEIVTPMSQNEVDLMKAAFIRQCTQALSDYVSLVYEHSLAHGVKPDYYHGPDAT